MRAARAGSPRISTIAAASARASRGGTRRPASPSLPTTSGNAPTAFAITGSPQAIASSNTIGGVSGGNIISANHGDGVHLVGVGATRNLPQAVDAEAFAAVSAGESAQVRRNAEGVEDRAQAVRRAVRPGNLAVVADAVAQHGPSVDWRDGGRGIIRHA